MTGVAWSVALDGVRIEAVRAEPEVHGELIHDWMNRPHVAPWWRLDRPLAEVRSYLTGLTHLMPWVIAADGEPFGYVETYRVLDDPLASCYPATASDVGWHVLVGPERLLGRGLPRLLGRAVLTYLLSRPGADRAVCEPDIRNQRMLGFCRALGCESMGEVDLPDKRAVLMACTRAGFAARWPEDLRLDDRVEVTTCST